MAPNDQAWIAPWVAERISSPAYVASAQVVGDDRVAVVRKEHPGRVLVGTIAVERVDAGVVRPLLIAQPPLDFIINVPQESYVTGDAIRLADARAVPIGGLGDCMRAVRGADVSTYKNPETAFLERGLCQHARVISFDRVHDRLYDIARDGLANVSVVFLNEYELTADHVRAARARYGVFQIVVLTNPNGRPTSQATEVARHLGAPIYKWGAFMGALNRP